MGITAHADWRAAKLVEGAAERASETGVVDLVDLIAACEAGLDPLTFLADVEELVSKESE